MPAALVSAHEDAVEAEAHDRWDEALASYYRALREDPMNYSLRVRLGQLQEKVGMFLAALDTYDAVRQATTADDYAQLEKRIYSVRARRQRRREALTARYRCVVLLTGGRVVDQWLIHVHERRDPALDPICERLSASLNVEVDAETEENELTKELLDRAAAVSTVLRLRLLGGNLLSRRLRHGAPVKISVSAHAVRVLPVYIALRRKMLAAAPGVDIWVSDDPVEWIRTVLAKAQDGLQGWGANYNAACCYALPLREKLRVTLEPDPDGARRNELARRAVDHLKLACASADSGFIAARRDWLLRADPDLKGLREEPVFKEFAARYLAVDESSPPPQADLYETSSIRYSTDLLTTVAEALADGWRRHAGEQPDVSSLLDWWREERVTWGFVRNVATNYRDPHARLALLEWTRGWCLRHGIEPFESRLLRHEQARHALERSVEPPPAESARERLEQVGALVPPQPGTAGGPGDWFLSCERELLRCTAANRQLTRRSARQLCERQVALWTRLGDWLNAQTEVQQGEREAAFERKLRCEVKLARRRVNGGAAASSNGDRPAEQPTATV